MQAIRPASSDRADGVGHLTRTEHLKWVTAAGHPPAPFTAKKSGHRPDADSGMGLSDSDVEPSLGAGPASATAAADADDAAAADDAANTAVRSQLISTPMAASSTRSHPSRSVLAPLARIGLRSGSGPRGQVREDGRHLAPPHPLQLRVHAAAHGAAACGGLAGAG